MTNLLLTAALLIAAPEFQATTLDGKSAVGALVELNDQRAVLETADGPQPIELATIATLSRTSADPADGKPAAMSVELVDDSRLAASGYTVEKGTAGMVLPGSTTLDIPTRAIRWVRFAPAGALDDDREKQWADIITTRASGDLLVVRQGGQLDFLEGVVREIDDQRCNFEIDGEVIRVNREKIEGIVYFHAAEQDLPAAGGRVKALDGSALSIHTVTLADGAFKIATPAGVSLELPAEKIARFDFTAGKLAYLSDLEPESAAYVPLFGFKKEPPVLRDHYTYRRDTGFEQEPLRLDGKTYGKGLALQSRTVLVYKLPGKFRLFKAVVGIDDGVRPAGNAKVEIKADGKSLWQADVRGSDPPHELELDVGGARRLEIVADYGDDLDIADRVDLCDARVTK